MREGFESSSKSGAGEGDIEHGDCNFGLGMSIKEQWARGIRCKDSFMRCG